jgi:RimJ/RimL family protein N-acetyltransferase
MFLLRAHITIYKIMDDIELTEIDLERDAPLATAWINGPGGARMLQLMGILVPDDFKTTLASEQKTLQSIVDNKEELAWMIAYDGQVVGILEVHLATQDGRPAPNVGIMIGDASARGRGIGTSAMQFALQELAKLGHGTIYARVLTHNMASQKMLAKLGFTNNGEPYKDTDNLLWQNYSLVIKNIVAY